MQIVKEKKGEKKGDRQKGDKKMKTVASVSSKDTAAKSQAAVKQTRADAERMIFTTVAARLPSRAAALRN